MMWRTEEVVASLGNAHNEVLDLAVSTAIETALACSPAVQRRAIANAIREHRPTLVETQDEERYEDTVACRLCTPDGEFYRSSIDLVVWPCKPVRILTGESV